MVSYLEAMQNGFKKCKVLLPGCRGKMSFPHVLHNIIGLFIMQHSVCVFSVVLEWNSIYSLYIVVCVCVCMCVCVCVCVCSTLWPHERATCDHSICLWQDHSPQLEY